MISKKYKVWNEYFLSQLLNRFINNATTKRGNAFM